MSSAEDPLPKAHIYTGIIRLTNEEPACEMRRFRNFEKNFKETPKERLLKRLLRRPSRLVKTFWNVRLQRSLAG